MQDLSVNRQARPEKVAVVAEVRERLSSSNAALLTEYRGLKVSDLSQLRASLGAVGGDYKIYKNTLVRFAARDLGMSDLEAMLVGPTAIAFVTGDAVDVARVLRDYARTNPVLVIKGGVLGTRALSADQTLALADVAPREVLLARLAGGLAAPLQQFAGLVQALPRNFAYGLQALIDSRGGVPDSPASEMAPAVEEAPAVEDTPVAEAAPAVEAAPAETTETAEPTTTTTETEA